MSLVGLGLSAGCRSAVRGQEGAIGRIDSLALPPEYLRWTMQSVAAGPEGTVHVLLTHVEDAERETGRLVHVSFDGARWSAPVALASVSPFTSTHSLHPAQGPGYLFWSDLRHPRADSADAHVTTDLYACRWQDGGCAEPVRVYGAADTSGSIAFTAPQLDADGRLHLVVADGLNLQHLQCTSLTACTSTSLGFGFYPALHAGDSTLSLAYVSTEDSIETRNDVYHRTYAGGAWSAPRRIHAHADHASHHPAVAVAADAAWHVAWQEDTGNSDWPDALMYRSAADLDETLPETLFTLERETFFFGPILAADTAGVVHMGWSHILNDPEAGEGMRYYYTARRDGRWAEPITIEPDGPVNRFFLTLDSRGGVHGVWQRRNVLFHARLAA